MTAAMPLPSRFVDLVCEDERILRGPDFWMVSTCARISMKQVCVGKSHKQKEPFLLLSKTKVDPLAKFEPSTQGVYHSFFVEAIEGPYRVLLLTVTA